MRSAPIPLILLLILWLPGCARIQTEKRSQGLTVATEGYGDSLRWGYYDSAYGYLHPSLRPDDTYPKDLDEIQVTAYEVIQAPLLQGEHQDRAEQRVHIEYVRKDEQVVHQLSDRQDWRFDPKTETWWLHSGLPEF